MMRNEAIRSFLILTFFLLLCSCSPDDGTIQNHSLYFGHKPPGRLPEIFAPGVVNTEDQNHSCVTISPDGHEIYWSLFSTISEVRQERIWFAKLTDDHWSPPRVAPFSGEYREWGPRFSFDGNRLYFTSCRPLGSNDTSSDANIWFVTRNGSVWGDPESLDPVINTEYQEWSPTVTRNGNLYYMYLGSDPNVLWDVYFSEYKNGTYAIPRRLGGSVNGPYVDAFPFIDPYEKYLIFYSERPGGYSEHGELYICSRNSDGIWSEAENLGPVINAGFTRFPGLSPDGRWFFFSCMKEDSENIYWMDAQILEIVRPGDLRQRGME